MMLPIHPRKKVSKKRTRFLFSILINSSANIDKNKKCANQSQRTEKRKLQLSPNKNNDMGITPTAVAEFAFLLNSTSAVKIGMDKKLPIKTESSPIISLFVFVWLLYYITIFRVCKDI
jgi:hypothetical protein